MLRLLIAVSFENECQNMSFLYFFVHTISAIFYNVVKQQHCSTMA